MVAHRTRTAVRLRLVTLYATEALSTVVLSYPLPGTLDTVRPQSLHVAEHVGRRPRRGLQETPARSDRLSSWPAHADSPCSLAESWSRWRRLRNHARSTIRHGPMHWSYRDTYQSLHRPQKRHTIGDRERSLFQCEDFEPRKRDDPSCPRQIRLDPWSDADRVMTPADLRRLRWSVPLADVSTNRWLDVQDSISRSLQALIRDSIQRDGYIDYANRPVDQLPPSDPPPITGHTSREDAGQAAPEESASPSPASTHVVVKEAARGDGSQPSRVAATDASTPEARTAHKPQTAAEVSRTQPGPDHGPLDMESIFGTRR